MPELHKKPCPWLSEGACKGGTGMWGSRAGKGEDAVVQASCSNVVASITCNRDVYMLSPMSARQISAPQDKMTDEDAPQ